MCTKYQNIEIIWTVNMYGYAVYEIWNYVSEHTGFLHSNIVLMLAVCGCRMFTCSFTLYVSPLYNPCYIFGPFY